MLFTPADFIILGVVLVVLLAYRQLDRGNRSLEKVKKYADKLQGDLSAYVDKRSEDLQRYAIELDVQQKAAKEVLKRIQGVEEGLGARAEAIGAIEKRLAEYDGVLARLMQMTAAVDENLARLHEESEFTDSVNRKLDAAQKGLEAIERELPVLRDDFARANRADLEGFKDSVLADIGKRLNETTAILEKAAVEAAGLLKKSEDARHEADREFALAFQRARVEAEKLEDAAFDKLKENSDAKAARLKETVEEKFREIGQVAKDRAVETQTLVKGLKADWKSEAEGLLQATKAEVGAAALELGKRLDAAETRLAEIEGTYSERAERVERKAEEVSAALQEKVKAILSAHKEDLERRAAESKARAEAAVAELSGIETKAAEDSAKRLAEFSSDIEGKFARLEAVNADIGQMEAALRESMAQAEHRVEGDFATFQAAFTARGAQFDESFQAETRGLREAMKSLESELDVLKSRAYENVSEKLKVFEDEFFADLKARSEGIDQRMGAWKDELDRKLESLAAAGEAERVAAEKAALDELRGHMAETQGRVLEQLEKLRDRVQGIADGIAAQGGMATEALEALKNSVRQDAADAERTARANMEAEIARLGLESAERLKTAERSLDEGLARVSKAEKASRAEFEAFMRQSQSDRERLAKELSSLSDRAAELRQDLTSRITGALASFTRGYEEFSADLARRQKEAEAEADAKLRDIKTAAADIGLTVETARAQAFARIEGEAARIAASMAEIDKERKEFLAQTKLFERTDELKASLAAAIDSMKADLARLDARKGEITEIENQLGRVKRLEDEVNQKVARFTAEKRRIDALEEDFGRLSEVSQGVDRRLEEVTGQSDALTEAQARIRKILELSEEAEAKFERLEKKSTVLDATAEAVDRNFQQSQGIEKVLAAYGAELKRLPERMAEIKRSVDDLVAGKARADEAAAKLGELDGILTDAEKRIAEAQKAREWLARAETRLEEVNRQATEQLKLLSTLLKEEGGKERGGARGAPPSTVQETVRKLARQGWTTDEIARAVKVSRGEVELILELGGGKA